jgi:His-Xaa-Ser repeat protein HxsA
MSRRFMIPTLLAAGFTHHDAVQASVTRASSGSDPNNAKLFELFKQDHLYTLAGHSSHSSHSSHASHGSGSSGGHYSHFSHTSHQSGNGGYAAPVYSPPVYTPPRAPAYRAPTAPRASTPRPQSLYTYPPIAPAPSVAPETTDKKLPPLSGRSAMFKTVVMHVQVALMGRGLFDGPIDGLVGPKMRGALRKFQQEQGLLITGTITPQTLDALHVSSQ